MQSSTLNEFTAKELDGVVKRIVQLFRECKNAVTSFSANLKALCNMTRQKEVLECAFRRQEFLVSNGKNSTICIPPLGVLNCFMPSVTEGLIAQHTVDQAALLASLFTGRKKWSDNVQKINTEIERVEERMLTTIPSPRFPVSPYSMMNHRSSHLPTAGGRAATSAARHEGPEGPVREASHTQNLASLRFLSTTLLGLHGIASVVTKMQSTLQEVVLAIRKDYQRIQSTDHCFADDLSFLLHSDTERYSGAQVIPLCVPQGEEKVVKHSCAPEEAAESDKEEHDDHALLAGFEGNLTGRHGVQSLFSFLEALEQLDDFVQLRWKTYCRSFLNEQSLLILES